MKPTKRKTIFILIVKWVNANETNYLTSTQCSRLKMSVQAYVIKADVAFKSLKYKIYVKYEI